MKIKFTIKILSAFCFIAFSFTRCLPPKADSSDTPKEPEIRSPNMSQSTSPGFEGQWSSETGWNLTITKVSDDVYDVRFTNGKTNEINKKASGPYNYDSENNSISKEVPVDYNDTENAINDIGKEYCLSYTHDDNYTWVELFLQENNNFRFQLG